MFHKLPKLDWFRGSQGLQIKKKNSTLHNRTRGLYGHFNKVVWGQLLNFYFYLKKKINWDIIFFYSSEGFGTLTTKTQNREL